MLRGSRIVIVGLTLLLAACDLSGADDTDGGDTESSTDASKGYCADVSSWDMEMTVFEEDVLVLVNEARAAGATCGEETYGPTGPLTMNSALRCASRVHSEDMAERNFFDHVNPDGDDPFVRMGYAGYSYFTAGENIAAGQPSPASVMESWMTSPGHCSNIMNPAFEDIGVGAYASEGGEYAVYWTQTFGAQ